MARRESDKEDLIRDATALVERAEFTVPEEPGVRTIGFFRDGRMVIYFDQDPFYQFDADGRLRRAFEQGLLYRSQGNTLAQMNRHREGSGDAAGRVILQRVDLDERVLAAFRTRMCERLQALHDAIQSGHATILRAVTEGGGLPQRTLYTLRRVLERKTDFLAQPPARR